MCLLFKYLRWRHHMRKLRREADAYRLMWETTLADKSTILSMNLKQLERESDMIESFMQASIRHEQEKRQLESTLEDMCRHHDEYHSCCSAQQCYDYRPTTERKLHN